MNGNIHVPYGVGENLEIISNSYLSLNQYQAARMFNTPYAAVTKSMRQQSKGINFGLPYGMGDSSLGARIFGERNSENTMKAANLRKKFFQGQELIEDFFEKVRSEGVRKGYTETQWGRRRYYHKGVFSVAEIRRQAGNHVIQGTAADIYKQSVNNMFVRICKEGWLGKVLINGFIHDEMLIEVHKSINPYYFFKVWRDEFEVRPAHYCKLYAGAGVGKCWYDAKKLDLPPLYIQEIIDQYQEGMPWNENFDDFLADVKKGFKQHKINRIRDYITADSSQGEIIKPAISSLLGDEMDNIIAGVLEDDLKLSELNSILENNKIEKDKKNKISGLQEQLKAYCYYYGVDYSTIDIKSPDDISVMQKNNDEFDESDEDEVILQVDKNQLLEVGLISNGIIADYETMTVHMGELMLRSQDKFIKGTAHFIQKDLIVKQTENMTNQQCYKIMYYPTLKDEHPKGIIIDGYVIPKDNLPVLLHFYKEMVSRQYAFLVNR